MQHLPMAIQQKKFLILFVQNSQAKFLVKLTPDLNFTKILQGNFLFEWYV